MESFILVHEQTTSGSFVPAPVRIGKMRTIQPLTNQLTRLVLESGREFLVKETPDEIVRLIEKKQRA